MAAAPTVNQRFDPIARRSAWHRTKHGLGIVDLVESDQQPGQFDACDHVVRLKFDRRAELIDRFGQAILAGEQ